MGASRLCVGPAPFVWAVLSISSLLRTQDRCPFSANAPLQPHRRFSWQVPCFISEDPRTTYTAMLSGDCFRFPFRCRGTPATTTPRVLLSPYLRLVDTQSGPDSFRVALLGGCCMLNTIPGLLFINIKMQRHISCVSSSFRPTPYIGFGTRYDPRHHPESLQPFRRLVGSHVSWALNSCPAITSFQVQEEKWSSCVGSGGSFPNPCCPPPPRPRYQSIGLVS